MKSLKVMLLGIAVAACGAAFSSMGVVSWIFGIVGLLLAVLGFFMRNDAQTAKAYLEKLPYGELFCF